jgi:alcohol dehydrogenase, propanol-preferring
MLNRTRHACGRCGYCVSGRETLCLEQRNTGYGVDGGFAEYAVADANFVVPVPNDVTAFDAAPLTCAGVTTYKAIKVADIVPSERVAIFGIGGLGHLAVQYANIVGGTVIGVDVTDEKLRLAKHLGAEHVVNAAEAEPARRSRISAAPMLQWHSLRPPRRSSKPSAPSAAAADWSASRCPRTR